MSDDDPLRADDIPWGLPPLPRLELLPVADLLALDPGELLEYAADLQRDLLAVRGVMHAMASAIARLTKQRDRAIDQVRRGQATRPPS
jgi:hypothetical protein